MMKTIMKIVLSASSLIVVMSMAGCMGGKTRYPKYYSLEIAPEAKTVLNDARLPGALAVRRFETPMYLRQGRIVYREVPEEIGFYDYHRWAADPGAAVTAGMIDSLRSARIFSLVKPYDSEDKPEYLLTGRLERLDEIDFGGSVRVEAKLSAELVNLRTGQTLWTGESSETSKIATRNINSVVTAMSQAVQTNINRLVAGVDEQLVKREQTSQINN